MDRQELSGAENGDGSKCPELSEVPIPSDQRIGSGLKSAFEDTVVRLIVPDDMNRYLGLNELRELPNPRNGLSRARARPSELGKQNPFDLLEDRRGDEELAKLSAEI